ncbi:hypothetical protein [Actinoplanes awajinensis]|uniref:Uncharacterized protein n=1 Tax=Actinoplanes awajinensis subsp. mycoplanecinus TaxID=135947 RepID=A0A101JPT9_9ACTN|nr:hypothetical protein [Actinoplanes awajinensis]KUL30958.1 hypothetical protein ADL15_23710 [Actinoplanes awajinensis subsp. mycoplanecinus]
MTTEPDAELNRAVTVFVWGDQGRPWPSSHPGAVSRAFGDAAPELLRRIAVLIRTVDRILPGTDLTVYAHRVEETLRADHPELDQAARAALVNRSTYAWR